MPGGWYWWSLPIKLDLSDDWLQHAAEGRLFVVSPVPGYAPGALLEHCDFVPDGVVFRAVLKTKTGD